MTSRKAFILVASLLVFNPNLYADPHADKVAKDFGTPGTGRALDKSTRVTPGVIQIKAETFSVASTPADPKVKKDTFEKEVNFPGERVYPEITGRMDLVNSGPGISARVSISSGDGVYGSTKDYGLYLLYKVGNNLVARFLFDVLKGDDKPVIIGTISDDGKTKLKDSLTVSARLSQHQSSWAQRNVAGNDWDNEKVYVFVDGIGALYKSQYPKTK